MTEPTKTTAKLTRVTLEVSKRIQNVMRIMREKTEKDLPFMEVNSSKK